MKGSKENLNILVLHSLGEPGTTLNFLKHHIFSLSTYQPHHNYLYHDVALPLPDYVRACEFDLIILDVTLLCYRWLPSGVFEKLKHDYAFVAESSAVKFAFPQDEYDCSELLDNWLCDWRVDVVFSVISGHWDVLYPRYSKAGSIHLGYTGYIDESLINFPVKPFNNRSIDIGYRSRKLPPYFGRIGERKWTIGRDVLALAREYGLKADIVMGEAGVLLGDDWLNFINECKFTLGANSGSSLLDPRGEIQRAVRAYLAEHSDAGFDEVEKHCFKGLDGLYSFTAISPRVLEAAMLGSCQVLVEGDYSGLIIPWEDYLPLKSDLSNFREVFAAMQDRQLVARMVERCRAVLLDCKELRYATRAEHILEVAGEVASGRNLQAGSEATVAAIRRYQAEMPARYENHWRKQRIRRRLVREVDRFPRLSRLLRSVYSAGNFR